MSIEEQIMEMAHSLCGQNNCAECVSDYRCEFLAECGILHKAGYRKQEWISVEERLPTWQDGKVLVFTTYGFSVCERTVNGRWQGKHANWITHWMPLPEPPKGE